MVLHGRFKSGPVLYANLVKIGLSLFLREEIMINNFELILDDDSLPKIPFEQCLFLTSLKPWFSLKNN